MRRIHTTASYGAYGIEGYLDLDQVYTIELYTDNIDTSPDIIAIDLMEL